MSREIKVFENSNINLLVKKVVLDSVILNQNKAGFFHRIQNLCKATNTLPGPNNESRYKLRYKLSVVHRDVLSRVFHHPKSRNRKRQTKIPRRNRKLGFP